MEGAVLGVSVTSEWSVECGGVRYAVCGVQCEYGHPWTLNEHAEWRNDYRYAVARRRACTDLALEGLGGNLRRLDPVRGELLAVAAPRGVELDEPRLGGLHDQRLERLRGQGGDRILAVVEPLALGADHGHAEGEAGEAQHIVVVGKGAAQQWEWRRHGGGVRGVDVRGRVVVVMFRGATWDEDVSHLPPRSYHRSPTTTI